MRKSFKLLSLILALIALFTLTANAEYSTTAQFYENQPDIDGSEIFFYDCTPENLSGYNAEIDCQIYNLGTDWKSYCLKLDGCTWYHFTAPSDGEYTFIAQYIACDKPEVEGFVRALDFSIDDPDGTKRTTIALDFTDDYEEQKGWVSDTFYTTEGEHDFYFYAPSDMDDEILKSCDLFYVGLYLTDPVDIKIVDPAPSPSEYEKEKEEKEKAAQTSDLAVVAIIALGAFAVAKKH